MSYLNADIPPIYCKIRKEYLYDLKKHQGESVDCCIFSVVSITDRALLFNIMLPNGACFWRLPISAFFQEKFDRAEVPDMPIDQLQLWNCFSYYPSVHCFSFLRGKRGKYYGKDKKNYPFEYLFTIDWGHPESNILDTEHSEIPAEHKCAHILALDDGNYAAQPNNRILWDAPNYTVGDGVPDYSVQTTKWNVENKDWLTEDSDKMFYEIDKMIDKFIYNFFGLLDKAAGWIDNILFNKKKKEIIMEYHRMNYYFTGALIIAFVLIALFLQPGYIPR